MRIKIGVGRLFLRLRTGLIGKRDSFANFLRPPEVLHHLPVIAMTLPSIKTGALFLETSVPQRAISHPATAEHPPANKPRGLKPWAPLTISSVPSSMPSSYVGGRVRDAVRQICKVLIRSSIPPNPSFALAPLARKARPTEFAEVSGMSISL
jgi:hypothetical protein